MNLRNASRLGLAAVAAFSVQAAADVTVVDFENGTAGWFGPEGFGGTSFIDPTNGVGGSAGYRTQFQDFGVAFVNDSNPAFIGDFSGYTEVTISIEVKVDQIGTFIPVGRPFMVELRDFDTAQGGYPWSSVYFLFDWIAQGTHGEYTTFSVTIDPTSTVLPAGWGGYGDEDPDTFEPRLPDGVTFADILAGVDEMAFSTLLPGYFFTEEMFDITIDNVTIEVGSSCAGDFDGDGEVNTLDVLAFLNAWSAGDSSADINGDGTVNTQDVLAFLNLWTAGC